MADEQDTRDIEQVSSDLGIAYAADKLAEKDLKNEKAAFYKLLDEEVASEKLAHKKVDVPHSVDPDEWLEKWHPGWRFADDEKKIGKVVIEEHPSFKKRTYVNREDGVVYGRTVKEANPSLDDERLREQDPELWERISHTEEVRVLNDLETISKADFAKMKKYFVPGKLTVSLMTPRKAKPDELDEMG
jgi:hypothetical protein